tara:strand:+ start:99 stop:965 length:867 start_codon:yes stop_codon:yes gene_type:complete
MMATNDAAIRIDGSNKLRVKASGDVYLTESGGNVFIGDTATANGNMTEGLTIHQGAADNEIFALKSSDVAHGRTGVTETDTYFSIKKTTPGSTGGGATMNIMSENAANQTVWATYVAGGTATTNKTTASAQALIQFDVSGHNDANAGADVTDNGNIFGVTARTGGAFEMQFMVDEDGDLHGGTANTVIAFTDSYDDAQLVRALDHAKDASGLEGMVRDKWDDFIKYNEQDLIDAKILGDTIENGGMLNVTGLQRLHNGAIWQGYVRQQEMQEKIDTLENRLLAIEGAK